MKKNPIQKLLAVVTFVSAASTAAIAAPRTLANGAPAPGNTVAKGGSSYKVDKTERSTQLALNAARRALSAAYTEEREAVALIAARPRMHANGAPACGNVNEKPVMECTDAVADNFVTERIKRVMLAGERVVEARRRLAAAETAYAVFRPAPTTTLARNDTLAIEVTP
jgi:hypothetical protein